MPSSFLYLGAKYGSGYFLLKVTVMKQNIVDAEIMSMGLDKEWANKAKAVVQEVRTYPKYLLYDLNEQQQSTIASLGAMYWREYINDLSASLWNNASSAEFAERCGWYSTGNKDCEYHHSVLLGIYEELFIKLRHNSSTFFCYRPSAQHSSKRIIFEKISDLEVLEYAIRNIPSTGDCRANIFQRNPQSNRGLYVISSPEAGYAGQWRLPDRRQLVWKSSSDNLY